jgi:predicted ATP-dependent Lon-type protease
MSREDARMLLRLALELRLHVRLQMHKMSPQEFPLTTFSFIDKETGERETVQIEM